jgi:HEAT repeat protein
MLKYPLNQAFLLSVSISIAVQPLAIGRAAAQPIPFRESVSIGLPARSYQTSIVTSGGKNYLKVGRHSVAIPDKKISAVKVESIELSGGGKIAIVRIYSEDGQQLAAIVSTPDGSRPETIWLRSVSLSGDRGERTGDAIEIADRDGDGKPEVVVGRVRDAVRICGQNQTVLSAETIDAKTFRLRPAKFMPDSRRPIETVVASKQSPGPTSAPLIKALAFTGASSQLGADPADVAPPIALNDGSISSVWIEEGAPGKTGEFVTARNDAATRPIKALAFIFSPGDPNQANKLARPKKLWLISDAAEQIEVQIPEDPASSPGQRFWVVPKNPLRTACLSVVLDEAYRTEQSTAAPVAIAEIETYTDLDFGGGLKQLLKEMSGNTAEGANAAELLSLVGEPAIEPISRAWQGLDSTGRRRAVRIFGKLAKSSEAARVALSLGARDADDGVSKEAFEAFAVAGPVVVPELLSLVLEQGRTGDRAANALAQAAPIEAVDALLKVLEQKNGSETPLQRQALAKSLEKSGETGKRTIDNWLSREHSAELLASVVFSVAPVEKLRATATRLLEKIVEQKISFPAMWHLIEACKLLNPSAIVDAWLVTLSQREERWMLRAAAVRALYDRRSPSQEMAVANALRDSYPRVRASVVPLLADVQSSSDAVAQFARNDPWPLVRASALEALGGTGKEKSTIIAGVTDPAKTVRLTAIRVLAKNREKSGWSAVKERLKDRNEWPEVTAAAIGYAKMMCVSEASSDLKWLVERGLKADAWLRDVEVAATALEALGYISGPEAMEIIKNASLPGAPAQLQVAAKVAAKFQKPCAP